MSYRDPEAYKAYQRRYQRKYQPARYKRERQELIDLLGGKCVRCGSLERLEFDHVDASTKSFDISVSLHIDRQALLAELKLCQLLCNPCHRKKSAENGDVVTVTAHGTRGMWRKGCRCRPCVAANYAANKKYRLRKE